MRSTGRRSSKGHRPLAVDGLPECVDHPAEERVSRRHLEELARALDAGPDIDEVLGAEHDAADDVAKQVEGDAVRSRLESHHLLRPDLCEPPDERDAVADLLDEALPASSPTRAGSGESAR